MLNESWLPSFPFKHVPFPDAMESNENEQEVTMVLVVVTDPPAIIIIEALRLACEVEEEVTVRSVNERDPAEI